jgi:hypothetical protein
MRPFNKVVTTLALAAIFAMVAGCSEYLDRRDTIALSGGNSVATDQATHIVDPWPRDSANRDIAFNGDKMQTAVERYRTNKVIPPQGIGTGSAYQAPAAQNNAAPPVGQSITQAPVK